MYFSLLILVHSKLDLLIYKQRFSLDQIHQLFNKPKRRIFAYKQWRSQKFI
jgi:hypothetical protein